MTTYIGIDMSKDTFDASTLDQKKSLSFKNNPTGYTQFLNWLSDFDQPHIGMEATGKYYLGLALFLHERNFTIYVINPRRVNSYAQSNLKRVKTDSEDAKLIAQFCSTQPLKPWVPDSPLIMELQEFYKLQQLLIHARTQLKNQMKSSLNETVKSLQTTQINHLDEQISDIQDRMRASIETDKTLSDKVEILQTIKGVGEKTAIELLTFIKDINRFEQAKQLASYAGITPQIKQSGTSLNSASLSKMGNSDLRKALYMPAVNASVYNPVLKKFADGLRSRGVKGKKVIVAVMRKLIHIVFALLKSGKPFDPEYKIRAWFIESNTVSANFIKP